MYQVKFIDEAIEDLKKLPRGDLNNLRDALERVVACDPIGSSEELVGPLATFRSFHHGEYRVVYRVFDQEELVVVAAVGKKGPPADVYAHLEELANSGRIADSLLTALRLFS